MKDIVTCSRRLVEMSTYTDFTIRQLAMLGIVCDDPGPHHVRTLAKAMMVNPPIISRAVDKLSAMGLVRRAHPKSDRRDCVIVATDQGMALRQALCRISEGAGRG